MDTPLDCARAPPPYACRLDAQPDHLTPAWLTFRRRRPPTAPLRFTDGIRQRNRTLWVPDAATKVDSVFVLHESSLAALRAWRRGETRPAADLVGLLRSAGIVSTAPEREATLAEWRAAVVISRSRLSHGFAPIRGLIHPFQLGALRHYFRRKVRQGDLRLGDPQCPLRYVAHNDPAATFFHRQLARPVSDLIGRPVKPSYCYFISYQGGAELPMHVDRIQCRYTLALCLDFSPEPVRETSWPLQLRLSNTTVSVYQALGDALLYEGTKWPHFRHPLAAGCTSTSILFHYVDKAFSGSLR
jgi:hypothetical protein